MIERLDAIFITLYKKPLILLGISLVPTLIGSLFYLFAPTIDDSHAFFLPLLPIHRWGIIAALSGVMFGLIFYAQHHTILRSLVVFLVVGVMISGGMSLIDPDPFERVRHFDSVRVGGNVYHLGGVNDVDADGHLILTYAVYRCDTFGVFCRQIGRDIVPSISEGLLFQYNALLRVDEGRVRILDEGSLAILFEYMP